MAITILDAALTPVASLPATGTVSAGSNRWAIYIPAFSSGGSADGATSVTLGGQSMTLLVEADTASTDVAIQIWVLNEAGIAAMSGSTIVTTGASSTAQSGTFLTIQDADQTIPVNTATDYQNATSGNLSLVRSATSWTIAAILQDWSSNNTTLTNPTQSTQYLFTNGALAYGYQTDSAGTSNVGWTGGAARDVGIIAANFIDAGAGGPTVTQTDVTPTDNAIQTINSTGLTVAYTAASVGGASVLAGLSNTDPTTASTYTQNNFVTVEGPVSRISEAVDLSVTATGGTATQSVTIGPATGLAVVTLTSVDRATGAPDSNMILDIEATGETVAIGDQFYYETADNTSITVAGVPTSDAVTFDLVLIQGSVTSANGVPFTINTASVTAPTLTLPTSASITKTGATIGCTTDESGGTMYFYISTNATETAATIKASGETQTVSATGIQTKALTGLSPSSNYYGHMIQVDSDTEDSNVVNTTQFTTLALDAPVLATTSSFNKSINVAASGQLVQSGGDTATSWSNPAGTDGAQYTITSGGVWTRTANNPTIESEVFTTTATNSGGTSGVQTVTVTYTETTTEISGEPIIGESIESTGIQSSTI